MKIVVYRLKDNNKITRHHLWKKDMTEEMIERYNKREDVEYTVEVVDLSGNEIAMYFYEMKERKLADYLEDLKDIKDTISDIESRLEDRLDDLERKLEDKDGEV